MGGGHAPPAPPGPAGAGPPGGRALPRRGLLGLAPGLLLAPALHPGARSRPGGAGGGGAPGGSAARRPAPWTRCSPPAWPGACPASPSVWTVAGRRSSRARPGSPAWSGRAPCGPPTASASTASPRPSPPPSCCSWPTRGCSPWTTPSAGGWTTPAVARIPHVERITLRQLLTHTSGIYDYQDETDSPFYQDAFFGPGADWSRVWTPPELLAYADGARHAPYFAPGQGMAYANTNYVLLGLLVEAATGRPFQDELRDRILGPLALDRTTLEEGAALPEDVVNGYQLLRGATGRRQRGQPHLGLGGRRRGLHGARPGPLRPRRLRGGAAVAGRPRGDVHLRAGDVGAPRVRHGRVPGAVAQRRADRDGRRRGRGHLDHDPAPRGGRHRGGAGQRRRHGGLDHLRDEAFALALA